jgi:hypothetical protein
VYAVEDACTKTATSGRSSLNPFCWLKRSGASVGEMSRMMRRFSSSTSSTKSSVKAVRLLKVEALLTPAGFILTALLHYCTTTLLHCTTLHWTLEWGLTESTCDGKKGEQRETRGYTVHNKCKIM